MSSRFSAFVRVTRLQAELNRLFEEASQLASRPAANVWQPDIDVIETPDLVRIAVEVPGIAADDLAVEIAGGEVVVSGQKSPPLAAPGSRFHCVEREHGRFARRVRLAWPVNTVQGRARLTDGVLWIELPKVREQRQQSTRLPIESDAP